MDDVDFGKVANDKLRDIFSVEGRLDQDPCLNFFLDYIYQDMPLDHLITYYFTYAPFHIIRQLADSIGAFEISGDE